MLSRKARVFDSRSFRVTGIEFAVKSIIWGLKIVVTFDMSDKNKK